MKILVPIKRVPDPYSRVRLTPDGQIDESGFSWVINPFDEIALEEAVRLKEAVRLRGRGEAIEIVVVGIGDAVWADQMRTALAMGADRALLILSDASTLNDAPADPGVISHLLAAVFRREIPNLVLMGKQATDDDSNQTAQRLAALLDLPQATFASSVALNLDGTRARVTREVDAGQETLEVALPAVITADLRLNEPRYVALPAILKARSKPMVQIPATELGPVPPGRVHIIKREMPPERHVGRRIDSVDELVDLIREAAGRR